MLKRGFSFVEIVTAVVIIAVMVGFITPVVTNRIRYAQATAAAETFETLRIGIKGFKEHVGKYPSRISQLRSRPQSAVPVVNLTDICNVAFASNPLSTWRGPYVARFYGTSSPTSFTTGEWVLNDVMIRAPAGSSGDTARIYIEAPNMPVADANKINTIVDGPPDRVAPQNAGQDTAGVITWGTVTGGTTTLRYGIMIRGC